MELVIVALVIGIWAVIAIPRFAGSVSLRHAEAAARRISADLALAQSHAMQNSTNQTVTFLGNGYTLNGMAHLDNSSAEYDVDLSMEPYNSTVISVDFGGDNVISFDIYGFPDSGGTVVIESGGFQKTVTLDPDSGETEIQ